MTQSIRLRPYQADAIQAATESIDAKRNDVLSLPTGSGKSIVIANLVKRLGLRTIVLQPTVEILSQNYKKMQDLGESDIAKFSASARSKEKAGVTFAMIGSIISNMDLFSDAELVIVDECHLVNARGGQYKHFIETIGAPCIGLTATPYRIHRFGNGIQARFLHRTRPRLFDGIAYIAQNKDLHEQGYLSAVRYTVDEDYDSRSIKTTSSGLEFDADGLARYNRRVGLVDRTVRTVLDRLSTSKHVLVFASSVNESMQLNEALRRRGIVADHVDGNTGQSDREDILSRFMEGRAQCVTNVGVLTTGFDFPSLDCVVLARPTLSLPLYYQMVGRGVRCSPGKKCFDLIDLCGNVRTFGRPDEYVIVEPRKQMHRLMYGVRPLTGIDLRNGVDYEKARAKKKKKAKATFTRDNGSAFGTKYSPDVIVGFGKFRGQKLSDVPFWYVSWVLKEFDKGSEWFRLFGDEWARRQLNATSDTPAIPAGTSVVQQ